MGNVESNDCSPSTIPRRPPFKSSPRVCRAKSFGATSPQRRVTIVRRKSGNDSCEREENAKDDEMTKQRLSRVGSFRSHSEQRTVQSTGMEKEKPQLEDTSGLSSLRHFNVPQFQICGDLDPHQINVVRRTWKQQLRRNNADEFEMATRLLLRIFRIEPRLQTMFHLTDVPYADLRKSRIFNEHVKAMEPTLTFVLSHLHDATAMSKQLQLLGGRHVHYTKITHKSVYWKIVIQAMMEFVGADHELADIHDAWIVLGGFCVEQMRIGYKIEYKLKQVVSKFDEKHRKSVDIGLRRQSGNASSSTGRQTSIC